MRSVEIYFSCENLLNRQLIEFSTHAHYFCTSMFTAPSDTWKQSRRKFYRQQICSAHVTRRSKLMTQFLLAHQLDANSTKTNFLLNPPHTPHVRKFISCVAIFHVWFIPEIETVIQFHLFRFYLARPTFRLASHDIAHCCAWQRDFPAKKSEEEKTFLHSNLNLLISVKSLNIRPVYLFSIHSLNVKDNVWLFGNKILPLFLRLLIELGARKFAPFFR